MSDQLFFERFVWFDQAIRAGRYPNAASLAEHFEVAPKTAQRSIDFFRDRLHAPLEYSYGHKGYAYSEPGFQLPFMQLSQQEVWALLVARQLLTELETGHLGQEVGQVTHKLGCLLAARLPGHVSPDQAFSLRWQGFYPVRGDHFDTVCQALFNSRLLALTYAAPSSNDVTMRTVEPHHLLNYMGTWHLIAYCRLRNSWRNFNLARIRECHAEETSFVPRPATDWQPLLTASFGIFQGEEVFPVTLLFSAERARLVRDRSYHPAQQLESLPDGRLRLIIPVAHPFEIMMEILGHGAEVEVLSPEWLRDQVHQEIRRMAARIPT